MSPMPTIAVVPMEEIFLGSLSLGVNKIYVYEVENNDAKQKCLHMSYAYFSPHEPSSNPLCFSNMGLICFV